MLAANARPAVVDLVHEPAERASNDSAGALAGAEEPGPRPLAEPRAETARPLPPLEESAPARL
eukprot:3159675-Alexandrium_andersonii.AAC.1